MGVPVSEPLRGPVFEDANVVLRGAIDGLPGGYYIVRN